MSREQFEDIEKQKQETIDVAHEEALEINKQIDAEKIQTKNIEDKNPEIENIKDIEELKKKAIEAGISPEDIEVLESEFEQARDGGEVLIAKKEKEYNEAIAQRQNLESWKTREVLEKEAENRRDRDITIAGAASLGALGIMGVAAYLGVNVEHITTASAAGQALFGLTGATAIMIGSPIARIQNWFARKKHKEELSIARTKEYEAKKEYENTKDAK